ncbi:MAG: hypothetical protein WB798_03300 [Nocardioidaceae bacterium]
MRTTMARRAPARQLAPLALGLTLGLVVAGCGGDADHGGTTSASATATASAGDPTTATSGPSPSGLRGRLLTADELPGFNDEWRWRTDSTAPASPAGSFATCQRFPITTAGAERAVLRRFVPAPGSSGGDDDENAAGEVVASFPDEQTARRAYSVLESWRTRCAERLDGYARAEVGDLEPVPVSDGKAGWYLLSYGPVPGSPDDGYFDAQGMVLSGTRIAMLTMVAVGQDYNYEAGQEPMVAALTRAAAKLG